MRIKKSKTWDQFESILKSYKKELIKNKNLKYEYEKINFLNFKSDQKYNDNIYLDVDLKLNFLYKKIMILFKESKKENLYNLLILEINKLSYKKNYSLKNGVSFLGMICLKAFKKFNDDNFLTLAQLVSVFLKSKIFNIENNFFIYNKDNDDVIFNLENGLIGIVIFLINYSYISKDDTLNKIIENFLDFIIKNLDKKDFGLPYSFKNKKIIYPYLFSGSAGLAYALLLFLEKKIKINNALKYKKILIKLNEKLKILNFFELGFENGALGILFVIKRIEWFLKFKSNYIQTIIHNYKIFFNKKQEKISNLLLSNVFLKIKILEI